MCLVYLQNRQLGLVLSQELDHTASPPNFPESFFSLMLQTHQVCDACSRTCIFHMMFTLDCCYLRLTVGRGLASNVDAVQILLQVFSFTAVFH